MPGIRNCKTFFKILSIWFSYSALTCFMYISDLITLAESTQSAISSKDPPSFPQRSTITYMVSWYLLNN